MEKYDAQKAVRVWQRVQAQQTPENITPGLQELIREEWLDASVYLQLSRKFQGKAREILQKMFREEQTHLACLKGIYTLTTGGHVALKDAVPEVRPPREQLRLCYGREMRALARYEERSRDPQYGQVFLRLAEQEREHCRMILELLGTIPVGSK